MMCDPQMIDAILMVLDDAFPKDVSLAEVKETLPQYAGVSPTDWLWAAHALVGDRYIEREGVIYVEQLEYPADVFAFHLTPSGRQRARECKQHAVYRGIAPPAARSEPDRRIVFISCGQCTGEEKALGESVCELVRNLTPFEPYFAEYQSNLEGVSQNILGALNRCVGFIGIMHPRGVVTRPSGPIARASVWIEQEVAIAAFMQEVLGRQLNVRMFIHADIYREGIRDKLILNPVAFRCSEQVLEDLKTQLPAWAGRQEPDDDRWFIQHRERALSGLRRSRRSSFMEISFAPMGRRGVKGASELPKAAEHARIPGDDIRWPLIEVYTAAQFAPKLMVDGVYTEDAAVVYRYWALSTRGCFYTARSLVEDQSGLSGLINLREQVFRIAEALIVCKRLYCFLGMSDSRVKVTLLYEGIKGRVMGEDRSRPFRGPIEQDEVEASCDIDVGQISVSSLPQLVMALTENLLTVLDYRQNLEWYSRLVEQFTSGKLA